MVGGRFEAAPAHRLSSSSAEVNRESGARPARPRALLRAASGPRALDELDAVLVRIADEADERASFAQAVRLALRLDSLLRQARKRRRHVVDRERDVAVAR